MYSPHYTVQPLIFDRRPEIYSWLCHNVLWDKITLLNLAESSNLMDFIQKSIWKDLSYLRIFISFATIITYSKSYFKDIILNRIKCFRYKDVVIVQLTIAKEEGLIKMFNHSISSLLNYMLLFKILIWNTKQ